MGKNSHGFYFALTINAPKHLHFFEDRLTEFQVEARHYFMRKKRCVRWAFCLEKGKNGDTPHIHALIEFDYDRRTDKVKEQLLNFFLPKYHMENTPSPNFLILKLAFNPHGWLTQYMTKENKDVFYDTYDLPLLKKLSMEMAEKRKSSITAYDLHKINRTNFFELYKGLLNNERLEKYQEHDADFMYKDRNKYYTRMVIAFMESGYQIQFLIYNHKQVILMMQLASGLDMEIFN